MKVWTHLNQYVSNIPQNEINWVSLRQKKKLQPNSTLHKKFVAFRLKMRNNNSYNIPNMSYFYDKWYIWSHKCVCVLTFCDLYYETDNLINEENKETGVRDLIGVSYWRKKPIEKSKAANVIGIIFVNFISLFMVFFCT